jgi:putative ABC transport system permease protein
MLRNFFTVFFRNVLRHKAYSLINLAGLAIGLACSILITVFVIHELSFDTFHSKADQIQRLCVKMRIGEQASKQAWTAVPNGPAFRDEIPEILEFCRVERWNDIMFEYEDNKFIEDDVMWTDSSFFQIFDFKLLRGDPETALREPNTIVLTEEMARKYFGEEDPMDKSIKMFASGEPYRVTGIVENAPANTHFPFHCIGSFHSLGKANNTMWLSHNLFTYFLLDDKADPAAVEEKLNPIMLKYVGPEVQQLMGIELDAWENEGNEYGMFLQPLTDIHLNTDIEHGLIESHDKKYVYIFSLIAVFILLIACINFMNLSTARSANRAREVGLRKVMGSTKNLLVSQFLWESVFLSLIAMIIAMLLVELLITPFGNLIGQQLATDYLGKWYLIPGLLLLVFIVGLLAGSYPAFFLSSFKPVAVLSGEVGKGMKSGWLRRILVVLQFGISIGIVICTLVVYQQINHMLKVDPGYDRNGLLVIERIGGIGNEHIQTFKQEIAKLSGVRNSTNSTMIMGWTNNENGYRIEGQPAENMHIIATNWVDFDYAETYGLEIAEGRFLSRENASDSINCVINEAAVRTFGLDDPLSLRIMQPGEDGQFVYHPVVGITKDFHYKSLHTEIGPYIFLHKPDDWGWGGYLSVRIDPDNINETVREIKGVWDEFSNDQPFDYYFLTDELDKQYDQESRIGNVFLVFALLAIFVACLGLLGLSSFMAEQRTKEIGVRKVMGASVPVIIRLISRETVALVLVAAIISSAIAWFYMNNWLESFFYRIKVSPVTILLAFAAALVIALITVSFQTISAAMRNPAEALRYE